MLTCRDLSHKADAYLDGELNLWQRLQIRLHLSMCNGCSRFMGQMRTTRNLTETAIMTDSTNGLSAPGNPAEDAQIDSLLAALQDQKQSGS
jgi:hypothetical protein